MVLHAHRGVRPLLLSTAFLLSMECISYLIFPYDHVRPFLRFNQNQAQDHQGLLDLPPEQKEEYIERHDVREEGYSSENVPKIDVARDQTSSQPLKNDSGVVKLFLRGRFGNNLFEVARAVSISTSLDYSLEIFPYGGLKARHFSFASLRHCFPFIEHHSTIGDFEKEVSQYQPGLKINNDKDIVEKFLTGKIVPTKHLKVSDWHQTYDQLEKFSNRIKEDWFKINPACCTDHKPGKDDFVLHYRNYQDELKHSPYADAPIIFTDLDLEYYQTVLNGTKSKVWIICEQRSRDSPLVQSLLQQYNAEVVSGSIIQDFCFLTSAYKIILARSTFSWWAAFLSSPEATIHYPYSTHGALPRALVPYDDPRYVYHDFAQKKFYLSPKDLGFLR